jgi:hypothetical protein
LQENFTRAKVAGEADTQAAVTAPKPKTKSTVKKIIPADVFTVLTIIK